MNALEISNLIADFLGIDREGRFTAYVIQQGEDKGKIFTDESTLVNYIRENDESLKDNSDDYVIAEAYHQGFIDDIAYLDIDSWDVIIPAVKKIERLIWEQDNLNGLINNVGSAIWVQGQWTIAIHPDMEQLQKDVVMFIEGYNKQLKPELEFDEESESDGVEFEIWKDKKTGQRYRVPIEIVRDFDNMELKK